MTAGLALKLWIIPERADHQLTYFLILVQDGPKGRPNFYVVETHHWSNAATLADRGDKVIRFTPFDSIDPVEVKSADVLTVRRLP